MDDAKRMKLIEIYERCSDDEIIQMLLEGKESFEEGAYDLIRIEASKRRINTKPGDKPGKNAGCIRRDMNPFGYCDSK